MLALFLLLVLVAMVLGIPSADPPAIAAAGARSTNDAPAER
jgi:hypothetical protein